MLFIFSITGTCSFVKPLSGSGHVVVLVVRNSPFLYFVCYFVPVRMYYLDSWMLLKIISKLKAILRLLLSKAHE